MEWGMENRLSRLIQPDGTSVKNTNAIAMTS